MIHVVTASGPSAVRPVRRGIEALGQAVEKYDAKDVVILA